MGCPAVESRNHAVSLAAAHADRWLSQDKQVPMPKVQNMSFVLISNDFLGDCRTAAIFKSHSFHRAIFLDLAFCAGLLIHHAHYNFATFHEDHT